MSPGASARWEYRQRRDIRDGASFNHVAAVLGEQRLEGQFPELVVRRDDQAGFAAQSLLSRLGQDIIKFASRIAEAEMAAGKLRAKALGSFAVAVRPRRHRGAEIRW